MNLLQEMWKLAEEVDDIQNQNDQPYVQLPQPTKKKKNKTKNEPTTDAAENSLINTTWSYSNSDAV